jgi:hypothetical protein
VGCGADKRRDSGQVLHPRVIDGESVVKCTSWMRMIFVATDEGAAAPRFFSDAPNCAW